MIARGAATCLVAALAVLTCATDASAQGMLMSIELRSDNPRPRRPVGQVNDLIQIQAALADCWRFPPVDEGRAPVDVIFTVSFKRSGELFGKPRVVKFSRELSDAERGRFYQAVVEAIDRCAPMPFTDSMGGAVAGRTFHIRFIDSRNRKQAEGLWLTGKS
jgi:hypothetical protein